MWSGHGAWRLALAALLALTAGVAGCGRAAGTCSVTRTDAWFEDARIPLVVGQDEASGFVPIAAGGDVPLVFGAQGGWMVVLTAEVPAGWADQPCIVVNVVGTIDGADIEPISVRLEPRLVGDRVLLGPLPVLLGFDPALLDGREANLTVWVVSSAGRAEQNLSFILHA